MSFPARRCMPAFLGMLVCLLSVLLTDSLSRAQTKAVSLDEGTRQRCLQILREGLNASEFWPAMHAAEALTLAGKGAEVLIALKPRLDTELDDQRRCGLARELVRAGQTEAAEVLLDILAAPKVYGHVHAAECLYKVRVLGDGQALQQAFQQSENLPLKLMASAALAQSGDRQALEFLRETLAHENTQFVRTASWILGVIGDASDIPRCQQQLSRPLDSLTKAYLEHALALLGDEGGLQALIRNLSHPDPAIRTAAANFAGDARASAAIDRLKEMLDDPVSDVRIRSAQSLLTLDHSR